MIALAQSVTDAGGSFVVAPNAGLLVWTALILGTILVAGSVTAAKGRWGWFALGWFTGGLLWLVVGALVEPVPGSLWDRRIAARGR